METKEVNADRELLKALAQNDCIWSRAFKILNIDPFSLAGLSDDQKLEIARAVEVQGR